MLIVWIRRMVKKMDAASERARRDSKIRAEMKGPEDGAVRPRSSSPTLIARRMREEERICIAAVTEPGASKATRHNEIDTHFDNYCGRESVPTLGR